jgi:peptidoglycan/xylan/chitin deacetylase (PgdA/CDA1 family)
MMLLARRMKLGVLPMARAMSLLKVPRVHVLCMHHVFDDEIAAFDELLDTLVRDHDLLTVSAAFDRLNTGSPLSRPIACITFDDGFAHHVAVAAAIRKRGGSATFFQCTGTLDASESERDEFCMRFLRRPPIEMLGWRQLEALANDGHEIGCHTATHRILSEVPVAELRSEINDAAAAMRSRIGPIRSFAWPFGRPQHWSTAAERHATEAGFDFLLSATPGCHTKPVRGMTAPIHRLAVEPMAGVANILKLMALDVSQLPG